MGYAKNWVMAFYLYSEKNNGQLPAEFDQAMAFLPESMRDETLLATNQFEILYRGKLEAIPNPSGTILLREYQTLPSPTGGLLRTYAFADGHAEVHKAENGDFTDWEAQHTYTPGTGNTTPKAGL
jgi:prepilin-type processing-associated H-X9-DG protein